MFKMFCIVNFIAYAEVPVKKKKDDGGDNYNANYHNYLIQL